MAYYNEQRAQVVDAVKSMLTELKDYIDADIPTQRAEVLARLREQEEFFGGIAERAAHSRASVQMLIEAIEADFSLATVQMLIASETRDE